MIQIHEGRQSLILHLSGPQTRVNFHAFCKNVRIYLFHSSPLHKTSTYGKKNEELALAQLPMSDVRITVGIDCSNVALILAKIIRRDSYFTVVDVDHSFLIIS